MSYKEHKLPDYFTNGIENVGRADKSVDAAFKKYGNNFDKLIISNDGTGYNQVPAFWTENRFCGMNSAPIKNHFYLLEWVIEKGLGRPLDEREKRYIKWHSENDYETSGLLLDWFKELSEQGRANNEA